jgi:hypothetical protein
MATNLFRSRHPMRIVNKADQGKLPEWLVRIDEELGCVEVLRRFKESMDVAELDALHRKFDAWVDVNRMMASDEAVALVKGIRCALKRRLNLLQGQPAFA